MADLYTLTTDDNGAVGLLVDDYELLDFFDDHFTESLNIVPGWQTTKPQGLWFPPSVSQTTIEQALAALNQDELYTIWLLNKSNY